MTQLTREGLAWAVLRKTPAAFLWQPGHPAPEHAREVADAIRLHHLTQVLTGLRHDNRPVSFGRAFEIIYGERLSLARK